MTPKNEAERHLAEYLGDRGFEYEYERPAGSSKPDFWVQTESGLVVCEVTHVTASLTGSGSFDAYAPLSKAVKRKSGQGRNLAEGTPYVVALWAPHWPTDQYAVGGALFGQLRITMPLDVATGTADEERATTTFGREATLHATSREHISAVVIIERFNPGLRARKTRWMP